MNFVYYFLAFCIASSLGTIIHELGHYFTARALSVNVSYLAFGQGPKLFSFHFLGTPTYVKLVPFKAKNQLGEGEISKHSNRDLVLIAISGVMFNLMCALILLAIFYPSTLSRGESLISQTVSFHMWEEYDWISIFQMPVLQFFINSLIVINIFGVIANLIPLPGSDGFIIIQSFLQSIYYQLHLSKFMILFTSFIASLIYMLILGGFGISIRFNIDLGMGKKLIVMYSCIIIYFIFIKANRMKKIEDYVQNRIS